MDQKRKQELREAYKNMKPIMGILYLRCRESGQVYLWAVHDTRGKMNGLKARLNGDMYKGGLNRKLQEEWNQYGESGFDIKILDTLEYDKDEAKTDYSEELQMLLEDFTKQYPGAVNIR